MNASSFFTHSPATLRLVEAGALRSSVAYKLLAATAGQRRGAGAANAGTVSALPAGCEHRCALPNLPSLRSLHALSLQAAKFAPLAGPAPAYSLTTLDPSTELLHRQGYWERGPDWVFEDEEADAEEDEDKACNM